VIYRKEIDGLRAVAVVAVLFFHSGFVWCRGGYLGVDVFFAISGYLITSIVTDNVGKHAFSFRQFYGRRARRILPALLFVTLISVPFAWHLMLPSELLTFAKSAASVALFSANLFFWRDSGYFSAANDYKPLIHTWTLGVEEQFYLLFPALLLLAGRIRAVSLNVLLVGLGIVSLCLANWADRHAPVAGFYLLPTRIWEFGSGALVAINYRRLSKPQPLIAALGLALVLCPIFAFSGEMGGQSLLTVLPVIGASLYILYADPNAGVGKTLASPVCRYVGLCSYSIYLVHQPLFAFARLRFGDQLSAGSKILLLVAVLVLAVVSFELVEKRFRSDKYVAAGTAYSVIAICLLCVLALAATAVAAKGFPDRQAANGRSLATIDEELRVNYGLSIECDGKYPPSTKCYTNADPDVLVWGDSFAMHVVPGLVKRFPKMRIVQYTKGGCAPVLGVKVRPAPFSAGAGDCSEFNSHIDELLSGNPHVTYAIISSPFVDFFDPETPVSFSAADSAGLGGIDRQRLFRMAFESTLEHLREKGVTPLLISPPPNNGTNLGECMRLHALFGGSLANCDFPVRAIERRQRLVLDFLDTESASVPVISLLDHVCSDGTCRVSRGDTFIYRDTEHLSYAGSELLLRDVAFPSGAPFER
jgi:peptidoglycan/LPS O-acetylase OafA/YrhL